LRTRLILKRAALIAAQAGNWRIDPGPLFEECMRGGIGG